MSLVSPYRPPPSHRHRSNSSGFEILHGLVERVFMMLAVPADSYGLRHISDPSFFEGRCGHNTHTQHPCMHTHT